MHIGQDRRPLEWPGKWDRTLPYMRKPRVRARPWTFSEAASLRTTFHHGLGALGVDTAYLSLTGSKQEPGVVCYFYWRSRKCALACDLFEEWQDNLQRVNAYLYGLADLKKSDWNRFLATLDELQLVDPVPDWVKFYGFKEIPERSALEKAHKERVFKAHPDRGGDTSKMVELNANIELARAHYDKTP